MNKHVKPHKVSSDAGGLRAVCPQNKAYALGLSVEMTANEPAFSKIPFGE